VRTWHVELAVVAGVMSGVALATGGRFADWVCAAAVLATFAFAQVGDRMAEREAARPVPDVHCWSLRYFVSKEALWALFFTLTHAWLALVSVGVFLAYPVWRRWWRRRHPLHRPAVT